MSRFLQSHATAADWKTACSQAIAGLGPISESRALGFVYFTDPLHRQAQQILSYLRGHTPVRHWVGSVAEGIVGSGREIYDVPAISLLVTDLDPTQFRIVPGIAGDNAGLLQDQQTWAQANFSLFSVVHGDPSNQRIPRYIERMSQDLGGGFLVGGLSSGASQSFVQIADGVTEGGLSGVMFAGGVPVITGLSQGCKLIGAKREITRVDDNIVYQLDGRPALDVLLEDIGESASRDLQRVGGSIFVALPVRGSDTGDYMVRNLLGADPDGKMLAIGDYLEEGMLLQFARRDEHTAREDLERMLNDVQSRLTGHPKGALYFSCLGRGRHLFGDASEELQLIEQVFGDLPLTGFYANGEISCNRLYGYTGVLTVFEEPH